MEEKAKSHLGWSNEGIEYYNTLYDKVEKDRVDRGWEFAKQMAMTLSEKGKLKMKRDVPYPSPY